jgi:hypothetical protein
MYISTKVIFEWDKKKKEYVEVHSEGYEYVGEVAECQYDPDILPGQQTAGDDTQSSPFQWGRGPDYSKLHAMSQPGGSLGQDLGDWLSSEWDLGPEFQQYFGGFDQEPFEFIGEQQDITESGLEIQRRAGQKEAALGLKKLGATYGLGMQKVGLGREALGTTARRGLTGVGQQRDVSSMKANMANVGGITESYNRQKDYLMGDYSAGMKGYGIQAAGLKSDLALGTTGIENILEKNRMMHGLGSRQAALDYGESTYGAQQKQEDQFYDDLLVALEAKG